MKNCVHVIHSKCLEGLFEEGKNNCPKCNQVILDGYEQAINP